MMGNLSSANSEFCTSEPRRRYIGMRSSFFCHLLKVEQHPMRHEHSHRLFQRALELMPGGVNSPARAFGAVGGEPVIIKRGQGAYLFDVDGNRFIDYIGSWGPMILGHGHPRVLEAIHQAVDQGLSFGAPTPGE